MYCTLVPRSGRFASALGRVEDDLGGLAERFFGPQWRDWTIEKFAPRTNVAETEDAFEVTVELPGLKTEEFSVEVHDGELCISGEKKEESQTEGKTYHRVERRYGQFRRTFTLPTMVSEDKIEAEYKDGILRVTVPKTPAAKPKQISVKA